MIIPSPTPWRGCNPMYRIALLSSLAVVLTSPAFAQMDTDLAPMTFAGNPITVRYEMPGRQNAFLFREYTFDEEGRPTRIAQGSERMGETIVVDFTLDTKGRVAVASASFMGNPTSRTTYHFDATGRPKGHHVVQAASGDEAGALVIEYDNEGHAVRETTTKPRRPTQVLVREFDDSGRPIKETITSGERTLRTIAMEYDENGCLVKRVLSLQSGREDWTTWERDDACLAMRELRTNAIGAKSLTVYEAGCPWQPEDRDAHCSRERGGGARGHEVDDRL